MKIFRTSLLLLIFTLLALADSTEIKRPTADADFGSMSWVTTNCGIGTYATNATAGTLGRDAAGQTTSVSFSIFGSTSGTRVTSRTYYSWASTSNAYTALTLNINSSGEANSDDIAGKSCLAYSLDSGVTWTQIRCTTTSWGHTTDTITLATSQDLTRVMVGACVLASRTAGKAPDFFFSSASVTVYDIWTSGTISVAGGGNGSGSGSAIQPVQIN